MQLTSKELGDEGESYACELLRSRGYTANLLRVNTKTYDIEAHSKDATFKVSVKVSRTKQHVRLGARKSVIGLSPGNYVFAFLPTQGGEIINPRTSPHALLIIPAELARDDSLAIHDQYWIEKDKDPNIFSVMVKGYGRHHREIWPRWLAHRDAWNILPEN